MTAAACLVPEAILTELLMLASIAEEFVLLDPYET